ncbi:hypothetical protein LSAT2_000272 [Lamellibrachia satsuma]|nr:hypothetical protein LSAT2_000272 [Lamellibrachia satsuma]
MTSLVRIRHLTAVLTFVMLSSIAGVHTETLKIIAVVDENDDQFGRNLERAVEYLNTGSSNVLTGHDVILDVISSRNNDSFAAMESVCSSLKTGVSVIVDFSSPYVTMTIRSLAEAMGITHVASVDPSYYEMNTMQYNTSVNFLPPSGVMLGAIRDIVSQENLTKVGIIYDQTFGK